MENVPNPGEDHTESKQREKLSQQLRTLSAMVPGLKTTEEDAVARDSIKYLKELQERVKVLEAQTASNTTDEASSHSSNETLVDVKAKISDDNVLIRIYSEKREDGVVAKAIAEIEKLNLTVTNSTFIPFGTSALAITVAAQMNKEFDMTQGDIVRELSLSFRRFM